MPIHQEQSTVVGKTSWSQEKQSLSPSMSTCVIKIHLFYSINMFVLCYRTGRSGNAVEKSTHPSPTRYDVNDKILHRASYSYNSVFKSKSQRDQKKQEKV